MKLTAEFFRIQLSFATWVASGTGMPLANAIMDYTNIFIRLGCGRRFDRKLPAWSDYIRGLRHNPDKDAEYTLAVWQSRPPVAPPDVVGRSGCFSFSLETDRSARIHFEPTDGTVSPLCDSEVAARQHELCGLLAQIVTLTPAVKTLRGLSWLYHHHRYRRLFPPAYLRSAMPVTDRYRNMPLWGQFLRWDGSLRAERASHLYQHIQGEFHPSRLATGFPLQPLAVSAPVTVFQAFYARR